MDKDPGLGGQGGNGGVGGDPRDPIAPFDNDSAANPPMDEFLSIIGDRELVYSDLISVEEGDREDFVQFELSNNSNPNQNIRVAIDCIVEGDTEVFARVEILRDPQRRQRRIRGGRRRPDRLQRRIQQHHHSKRPGASRADLRAGCPRDPDPDRVRAHRGSFLL